MMDFHCHLDLYENPEPVATAMVRSGNRVLTVTTTPAAWLGNLRLFGDIPGVDVALGLHPELAHERFNERRLFDRYLGETRFIGEVGLDGSPALRSHHSDQLKVFRYVLDACTAADDKIISIHSRRAAGPVLDVLTEYDHIRRPILHWFSGSRPELRRAVARDCWFSVGPAMMASAKGRELIALMPRNRVLVETDGPFARFGGIALEPIDVLRARAGLASIWGVGGVEAERIIASNEAACLRLPHD